MALSSSPELDRLATLSLDDFAPRVDDAFRMAEPVLDLRLEHAEALGSAPASGRRRAFSLLFGGPAEPLLAQGTYTLENPTLGSLSLFLVPVGSDGQTVRYEAIFN